MRNPFPMLFFFLMFICSPVGAQYSKSSFSRVDCEDYADFPEINHVGGIELPGHVRDVAVGSGYAYVAAYDQGLLVVDVSDPASPSLVGLLDTPGGAFKVTLVGNVAFVADLSGGLHIVDVTDPAYPTLVSTYAMGNCYDVWVYGNSYDGFTIFAADYNTGLVVLDMDYPSAPVFSESVSVPGNAVGVTGYYHYSPGDIPNFEGVSIYVASQSGGMMKYFFYPGNNLIDPIQYSLDGYTRSLVAVGSVFDGMMTQPTKVFSANLIEGLQVMGTGPGHTLLNTLSLDHEAVDVDAWSESWVGVTDGNFYLVGLNSGSSPYIHSTIDTPGTCYGVTIRGSYAYLADGHRGLQIYQKTDAGAVAQVSEPSEHISISGSIACAGEEFGMTTAFTVLDISDPLTPVPIGQVFDIFVQDLAMNEDWAYVAGNNDYYNTGDGLVVVDISTPSSPLVTDRIETQGEAQCVAVSDNNVLIADGIGIRIFDRVDPGHPVLVGGFSTSTTSYSVSIEGQYAYLGLSNGLQIFDISTPATPIFVGGLVTSYVRIMNLNGPLLFFAGGSNVSCIDISNPASPQLRGTVTLSSTVNGLTSNGNTVYGVGSGGVSVIDFSNVNSPEVLGTISTPGNDLASGSDYLFVGSSGSFSTALLQCELPASKGGPSKNADDVETPELDAPRFGLATPNPFNPLTTLRFYIPTDANSYSLEVFDQRGRLIKELASGNSGAGWQNVDWNGTDVTGRRVSSGMYFARLVTDNKVQVQKLTLTK